MNSKAIQLGLLFALALLITSCAGEANCVPEPRDAAYKSIVWRRLIVKIPQLNKLLERKYP